MRLNMFLISIKNRFFLILKKRETIVVLDAHNSTKKLRGTSSEELNRQMRLLSRKNSFSTVEITEKSRKHLLLTSLNYTFKVFQFHDEVVKIKNDTELLAANKFCRSQIVEIASNTDSVQGVPESAKEMLKNCMKRNLDFVQLGNDKLLLAVTKFRMDMII